MQIQRVQSNYNTDFKGNINTPYLKNTIGYAISCAKNHSAEDKKLCNQFFNTLKLMKNDGTDKNLVMRTEKTGFYENLIVEYGDLKDNLSYNDFHFFGLKSIVKFGETLFGKKAINANPKELKKASVLQEIAHTSSDIARQNQDIANAEYNNVFKKLLGEENKSDTAPITLNMADNTLKLARMHKKLIFIDNK